MNNTITKLQAYDNYKQSGVEWLGEIPKHWEVKKFKFILNQSKGLTITKQNLIDEGIFCVNYGEIHSKFGFELDTTKHKLKCVNEEYLITDSNSLLNKGDFIFADTSEDIEGSGNFTHLKSNDKTFAGYHTIIARPQIEIVSLFLAFVFDSTSFRNQIRKQVKGVKVFSITQSVLKETNIWMPPLIEQTAIAQFLDDKTTKIDQAIAIKQQQIDLLKERRQILIHKTVTQGINPDVKLKDSGVEWIGEIPEHWEVKALKFSTSIFRGKFTHRPRNDERLYDGKYPFFQTGDVARAGKFLSLYRQTLNDFGLRVSTLFPKGTIVMTIAANIGDISILDIDACFPDSIVGFKPMYFVEKDFLYNSLLVMKEQFMSSTIKNTQMNLNVDRIGTNAIPIPPILEQKEISEYIETATAKIATAISIKEQEIEKLKEYKSSLIDGVVTGKVKVY